MSTLAPQNTFSYLLDQGFRRASNYHMLPFQLLVDRFQFRATVGRNRLQESDWSFPFLTPFDNKLIGPRFEGYYWVEYCSQASNPGTSIPVVSPESVKKWHCWRWVTEFRLARWGEIFAGVKLNVRLGTLVWQLLLKTLCRPLFADHLSRTEHFWMLLHGAHPPRQDAGIFRPAFAQLWEGTLRISPATP